MVWGINSGSSYRESIEEDEYPARGSSRDEGHDSREYRSRGRDEGRDRYAPHPRETLDNGESSRAGHMSRDPPAVPYQQSLRPWTPPMKEGYADYKSAQYSSKVAREDYMMQYSQREREFLTRKRIPKMSMSLNSQAKSINFPVESIDVLLNRPENGREGQIGE